jgi:RNA polymerase sigma-70 factor, ECF subfamily
MIKDNGFEATMVRLRSGDEQAATEVFGRYVRRLVALAERQFEARLRVRVDVEDAVNSACRSFFARARRGEFDLAGWDELWSLLVIITLRKCARRLREVKATRRDPRREIESRSPEFGGVWQVPDRAPSPVEAAILSETAEELFRHLHPDDRPIVEYLLQGYAADEIAARLDCSERTVRRVRRRAKQCLERLLATEPTGA